MNDEPSVKEMAKLWSICMQFIQDQNISCEETIHQCDWVIENAYGLIQDICDVVGYHEDDENV